MEYGRLIRDAWGMTWRHKFLWILALFAPGFGGSSGSGSGSNFSLPSTARDGGFPSQFEDAASSIEGWVSQNLGLIVAVALGLIALAIVLIVLSLICQGAIASATLAFASDRDASFGQSFGRGLRLFWRYLGLALLIFLVVLLLIGVFVGLVLLGIAIGAAASETTRTGLAIAAVFLAFAVVLILIPVAIVWAIVYEYGQRAIADENLGPISCLRSGWRLFRSSLGTSLLVWLIGIGLAIVAAIALIVPLLMFGAVLVGGGIAFYAAAGWAGATIGYAVLASVVFLIAAFVMGAIAKTFFWSYWSLAYVRMPRPWLQQVEPQQTI